FHNVSLKVTGVVHQRVEKDGKITEVSFRPMVLPATGGKAVEFRIGFLMKPAVPVAEAAGLAGGEKVTIRGMISTSSNQHAALHYGEVVRESRVDELAASAVHDHAAAVHLGAQVGRVVDARRRAAQFRGVEPRPAAYHPPGAAGRAMRIGLVLV